MWKTIADLGSSTKKAILALGAFAGAVVAIVAFVTLVLPKGPTPKPPVDASFEEAKVDQNIVLAQYEYNNQPASTTNASDREPAQLKYRLAADSSTATSTKEETATETQTRGTGTVEESTGELEAKLAQATREREAPKTLTKERVEAKKEAILMAKEETTFQQEEEAENEVVPVPRNNATPGIGHTDQGGLLPKAGTSKEPAAPAKSFRKEGAAKVAVGTGAPTERVDAVLREARAILRRRADRLSHTDGRVGAAFEQNSLTDEQAVPSTLAPTPPERALITATSEAEGATLANSVPTHCGAGCALAPTVDKALADYSSNLAQAARVVAAAFRESRVEYYEAKPQPVGVTVDYRIHFLGYEGQLMTLEWTLDESRRPLPKTWWRKVVVKQIVPSSESIGVAGNFWAPVPPKRGHYYFSLRVLDASGEITHKASEKFS